MKNYVQPGDRLTLTAPYDVASGAGAQIGTLLFGVAVASVLNAAQGEFATEGVFDLTALTSDVGAVGAAAYWDNTNKRITVTVGSNLKVGVFVAAKANGETTARVRLNASF